MTATIHPESLLYLKKRRQDRLFTISNGTLEHYVEPTADIYEIQTAVITSSSS
jgi:hypothetical protein